MHRFVFADWANQRPNPSASLVVPAVHMTNHMWSHWSSACRLMLCFGVSRIYMLGNGIYLLLYAKLFLLWTSEVDSDNCWSLTCTETELGASSLLSWMNLCSFQFFKAAYVCTSDSCSLAQVYVTPQRQRIGGAGCVSLIWLLNTESGCYCNYFIIFPPVCDLAASFFPRSLKHPSHTQSHSCVLQLLLPLQTLKKHYSVP